MIHLVQTGVPGPLMIAGVGVFSIFAVASALLLHFIFVPKILSCQLSIIFWYIFYLFLLLFFYTRILCWFVILRYPCIMGPPPPGNPQYQSPMWDI